MAGTWSSLPAQARDGAYALQVQGDSMLPLYRDGDVLIVEPAAPVRRGDRVVVKTTSGEVMAKVLSRRTGREGRASVAQRGASDADDPDQGCRVARPHRLGEPVGAVRALTAGIMSAGLAGLGLSVVLAGRIAAPDAASQSASTDTGSEKLGPLLPS